MWSFKRQLYQVSEEVAAPLSGCRNYSFTVYGSDISTYSASWIDCSGNPQSVGGFVGDGNPPNICALQGSVEVFGNVSSANEGYCQ